MTTKTYNKQQQRQIYKFTLLAKLQKQFHSNYISQTMIEQRHEIWIRKRFPIFYTIKIRLEQEFTQNELDCLESQLQIDRNNMSKQGQKTLKKLRKLASQTQKLFKSNKQLYTILSATKPQQLHQIILSHKMVSSLDPLTNLNLQKLHDIDLSYNKIQNISPVLTCKLPELRYFSMERNTISSIKGLEQCDWGKLKILNLSHNYITNIQSFSLNEFPSLEKLDLSSNNITIISTLHKTIFKSLAYINLEKNRLKEVRNIQRIWVRKLAELNIKHNELVGTDRIQKFQPTTLKGKRVVVNSINGRRQEQLEFINYDYKISYSKALHYLTNRQYFQFFLGLQQPQYSTKNFLSSSKHSKHSEIDQFQNKQVNQYIIPTKKLLIFD